MLAQPSTLYQTQAPTSLRSLGLPGIQAMPTSTSISQLLMVKHSMIISYTETPLTLCNISPLLALTLPSKLTSC